MNIADIDARMKELMRFSGTIKPGLVVGVCYSDYKKMIKDEIDFLGLISSHITGMEDEENVDKLQKRGCLTCMFSRLLITGRECLNIENLDGIGDHDPKFFVKDDFYCKNFKKKSC